MKLVSYIPAKQRGLIDFTVWLVAGLLTELIGLLGQNRFSIECCFPAYRLRDQFLSLMPLRVLPLFSIAIDSNGRNDRNEQRRIRRLEVQNALNSRIPVPDPEPSERTNTWLARLSSCGTCSLSADGAVEKPIFPVLAFARTRSGVDFESVTGEEKAHTCVSADLTS
jgi:hypothetical protein